MRRLQSYIQPVLRARASDASSATRLQYGLIVSSMTQDGRSAVCVNGRLMMGDDGMRQRRQRMVMGGVQGRRSMSVRDHRHGRLHNVLMMDARRLGDDRIETVHGIGGVVDGASAAVRLDQRVLALHDVAVARLVLLLVVAGHMVGDRIAEVVVRMRIERFGSDRMMGNADRMMSNADRNRLHGNGTDGDERNGAEEDLCDGGGGRKR